MTVKKIFEGIGSIIDVFIMCKHVNREIKRGNCSWPTN